MNKIIEVAEMKRKEKYITPEDVSEALARHQSSIAVNAMIREDLLEIIGKQTEYGAEDSSLCAFIAWKGV